MKQHALSFLVLGILIVLALGSVDSKDRSPSRDPGSSAPPSSSRTPHPKPKPSTVDEQHALDQGIRVARWTMDFLLKRFSLNTHIAVTDNYWMKDGQVSVTLKIRLLSEDGRRSFADGSLYQVYPDLKTVYIDSLRRRGFNRVTVDIYTDSR